jgi:hypothetical protein
MNDLERQVSDLMERYSVKQILEIISFFMDDDKDKKVQP